MRKVSLVATLLVSCFCFFAVINIQAQTTRNPIIIVPGVMGSWNWDVMFGKIFGDGWNFTPFSHVYDGLLMTLQTAGLEQDKDFFIAFYDWRKSNIDSARDYLKPIIDKAKTISGKSKVDVVAHSMGGLVTRAYVLSGYYGNDVDRIDFLGVPNYGSSDVYTLWEGGYVPKNWDGNQQFLIKSYLNYLNWLNSDTRTSFDVVHQDIPSIRELLPVYSYLTNASTSATVPFTAMTEQNTFLQALNTNIDTFLKRVGHVTNIYGSGVATVNTIPVAQATAEAPLWTDGKPTPLDPTKNDTNGDNRVLTSSARFPIAVAQNTLNKTIFLTRAVWTLEHLWWRIAEAANVTSTPITNYHEIEKINVSHGTLPYDALQDVFTDLGLGSITNPPTFVAQNSELIISVGSPVSVKVTDPAGNSVDQGTQNIQIPGAEINQTPDPLGPKLIYVPNPLNGTYTVAVTGLDNGEYHVRLDTQSNGSSATQETSGTITTGATQIVTAPVTRTYLPTEISKAINDFYDANKILHTRDGRTLKKNLLSIVNKIASDNNAIISLRQTNPTSTRIAKYYKDIETQIKNALAQLTLYATSIEATASATLKTMFINVWKP